MENTLEINDILAILPFDHRTGLYAAFGWHEPITPEQIDEMKDSRRLVYESIQEAVKNGIPKSVAPVFTDDIFGKEVLIDAKQNGFTTFLTTEKSGSAYFDFEHGENFGNAINEIKPDYVKSLVRYNPNGNTDNNSKSRENLKKLSDFAHANNYKFLIEPLVPATDEQLASVANDKHRYDSELRADLTVRMIAELQGAGIEPNIWKIEGFENSEAYAKIVNAAQTNGRDTKIICLGRNETDQVVESWIKAGARVPGVIGFAVGRTVFLEPLLQYRKGEIMRDEATKKIAAKFRHFYDIFMETQTSMK